MRHSVQSLGNGDIDQYSTGEGSRIRLKGATFHQAHLRKHYKDMNYALSKYKRIKMTPWRSQLAGIQGEEETEPTDVSSFHLLRSQDSPLGSKEHLFAGHFERQTPPERAYSCKKRLSSKRALLEGYRENIKRYKKKPESNELFALTHTHFPRSNFADDFDRSFMQETKPGEHPLAVTAPTYNDLAGRRKLAKQRQRDILKAQRVRTAIATTKPQAYARARQLDVSEMESMFNDAKPVPTMRVEELFAGPNTKALFDQQRSSLASKASVTTQQTVEQVQSSVGASTFKVKHPSKTYQKLNASSQGDVTIRSSIRDAFETSVSEASDRKGGLGGKGKSKKGARSKKSSSAIRTSVHSATLDAEHDSTQRDVKQSNYNDEGAGYGRSTSKQSPAKKTLSNLLVLEKQASQPVPETKHEGEKPQSKSVAQIRHQTNRHKLSRLNLFYKVGEAEEPV